MLVGAFAIGQALSQVDSFGIAITSASEIFPIIDRVGFLLNFSQPLFIDTTY